MREDGTTQYCYLYDPFGRRVEADTAAGGSCASPSSVTYYFYGAGGGAHPLGEYTTSTSSWQTNVVAGNEIIATVDASGDAEYLALDGLGTVKQTASAAGAAGAVDAVYPYGEEASASGNEYLFTNQMRDPNGIDHFWMRSYVSTLGRWLTPDPAGAAAVDPNDPQTWNRYAYVGNGPSDNIDPSGEICVTINPSKISCSVDAPYWLAPLPCNGFSNCGQYGGFGWGNGGGGGGAGATGGGGGGGGATASGPAVTTAPSNGRNCSTNPASARQYAAATGEVGAMTSEFFSGLGPGNLTFGTDSATSLVMGQSGPVQEVLNSYYMTGQTSGLYTFGGPGMVSAGFNPVAQFVGSFRWSISGGTLSLTNTTSFRSLTYDMGPQWQRGSFPTPMGNTHQTYNISVTCH